MALKSVAGQSPWFLLLKNIDMVAAVAVVSIVTIIVIPIAPFLLDILLTINIAFSLVILLLTLFTTEALQLAVFPSLLLVATLFRLALNISSTRLILSEARAGEIIHAFGSFVVGGNYVVGMVIFVIITVIQFVVITNGAGRIAEVAARFTLDAMPGKQMSIDADFNAGLIDEEEARNRRTRLQREADFYGAMDGASKFVRGDAIAGIVIVLINILGGLAIGLLQRGMTVEQAVQTYTLLTVGDGLVAQIPALLVSTSAGMLVTRSASEAGLGEEFSRELLRFPRVIALAAGILLVLGLVPGLPIFPFFLLSLACGAVYYMLHREERERAARDQEARQAEVSRQAVGEEDIRSMLKVELLEIEIGYNLVSLTEAEKGGDLLERITAARRRTSLELGMVIQPIRIRDNLQLPPNEYSIKLKGNEIAHGELRPGYLLALNPGGEAPDLEGIPTREPTFNLPAAWIAPGKKEDAELKGYTVVDASTVLITHLTEVIKKHSFELLGRQEVKQMVEAVKENHPAVVEELIPDLMSIGEIQKVLQNLLREKVPIQDMVTILETLADYARTTKDPDMLTEYTRQALARTISRQYATGGKLKVITIDPALEQEIAEAIQQTSQGSCVTLAPPRIQKLVAGISSVVEKVRLKGVQPVLLTAPRVRLPLRRMLERFLPDLAILSLNEVEPELEVEAVGVVKRDED